MIKKQELVKINNTTIKCLQSLSSARPMLYQIEKTTSAYISVAISVSTKQYTVNICYYLTVTVFEALFKLGSQLKHDYRDQYAQGLLKH